MWTLSVKPSVPISATSIFGEVTGKYILVFFFPFIDKQPGNYFPSSLSVGLWVMKNVCHYIITSYRTCCN